MAMTIEHSLRRRAAQSRRLAFLCLGLSIIISIGTYLSLPWFADKTVNSIVQFQVQFAGANVGVSIGTYLQVFAITTLILGVLAVVFVCYVLIRVVIVEIELAVRFNGLADAICLAGDDFDLFEKAAALFAPKSKYLFSAEIFSPKNISLLLDVIKKANKL